MRALRRPAQEGRFTKATANRASPQFGACLVEIAASYPEADTICLTLDNMMSRTRKAGPDRICEKIGSLRWGRLTVQSIPKHGSWLNHAEIEISLFSRRRMGGRRILSLP